MKNCCTQAGCHVKTKDELDKEVSLARLEAHIVDGKIPPYVHPTGLMAHTDITSENLISNRERPGALLERPLFAVCNITITPKAKAGDIKLLLDYDDRHRAFDKIEKQRKGRVRV